MRLVLFFFIYCGFGWRFFVWVVVGLVVEVRLGFVTLSYIS